jgi:hypothetical protein
MGGWSAIAQLGDTRGFPSHVRRYGVCQGSRWTKDIGLGFKTPKEARTGTYVDKKCPFTGRLSSWSCRGLVFGYVSSVIADH